jgi:cell volume regulation protein A
MGLAVSAGHIEMLQSLQRPGIIFFIGSVALAMILFDSGFHTSMKNYKQNAKPALLLSTLGVVMTTLFLAPVVHFLLELDWALCFLLVAIISSTDSAAVFSLLRSKGLVLKERVKSTLEIESGTNDPMAIF